MRYIKPWTSFEAQLALLIHRGLHVTDHDRAIESLKRVGYYRLSGYWYAFRERSGPACRLASADSRPNGTKVERLVLERFKFGASFKNAMDLYVFDKQLRLLTMDALERIEIALRVDISYTLGKLDPFAYARPDLLHHAFCQCAPSRSSTSRYDKWIAKHTQLVSQSKEEFIEHNKAKYGLPLAIWIACEVWDFGSMAVLFNGMREAEQDQIAVRYRLRSGRIFGTWLRSLNYLRNVCAHHGRLWNRNIIDQPKLPSSLELPWVAPFEANVHARARCFLLLTIIRRMLEVIHPQSTWPIKMKEHLDTFPDLSHLELNLAGMGVVAEWQESWSTPYK